jgi:hypothetical protein
MKNFRELRTCLRGIFGEVPLPNFTVNPKGMLPQADDPELRRIVDELKARVD